MALLFRELVGKKPSIGDCCGRIIEAPFYTTRSTTPTFVLVLSPFEVQD